ncbi:hypothetical protein [Photorhabdus bodei]|nr:hypothetical protein [Photorhabdus bodei]
MTGVSECSQQRGNLKDDGYIQVLMGSHISRRELSLGSAGKNPYC